MTPTESLLFPYLESILIQENDLPPGYSASKISHKLLTYYERIVVPDADYVISLQIQKESVSGGQVMVFYYAIQGVTLFAFDSIAGDMRDARMLEGVGEMAKTEIASAIQAASQNYVGIVFVQCISSFMFHCWERMTNRL